MAKDTAISISFKLTEDANGLKHLALDAKEFRKAMQEAVNVSTKLQSKFINFAAFATSFRAGADSLRQLSDAIGNLTGESAEFSKAMRAANTMAGRDAAGFKQLKGEVAALAKEIPIARDQLANGLYQVISNGVPEDNWLEFLEKSARSAVGGIADVNKVVTVTSTLIKNYGLEWSAAGDIQDKIQLTAKNGVTSFELLAQALPRVTGNAATLGVSVDELLGTFATLTGVSGNTAEVSTQLAAVFTALVKPSSEAAEMAAKMGIEFNAAAIKGAGGFRKFLSQLDSSIKAYAQANGVLEQEVYSKLFGSAEALRALIPLQGELAGKFQSNVAEMANSAGTMDAAYKEMASTGEATAQRLQNSWGAVTDRIAKFTAPVKPFVDLGASIGNAAVSVIILAEGFRKIIVNSKIVNAAIVHVRSACNKARLGFEMLTISAGKTAASAAALKIALRGLLLASGVGVVIAAVSAVIGHLSDTTDEATNSTIKLLSAQERAKRDAEQLEQLRRQEASTLAQTRAALVLNTNKLKEFNGTKEQEKALVNEMNNTYGDTMGYFSSVADWYKALTANSEAYCRQMVIEARTRILADRIAKKEQENHEILYNDDGSRRKYSNKRAIVYDIKNPTFAELLKGESIGPQNPHFKPSDKEVAQVAYDANSKAIKNWTVQLEKATEEASKINFRVKGSDNRPSITPDTPFNPSGKSNKTTAAVLEKPAKKSEWEGYIPMPVEELKTYAQLNEAVAYYEWLVENGTEKERISARQHLNDLDKVKRKWDEVLDELSAPGDISTLDSFEKLDDAISYIDGKIQRASDDEIAALQRTKMAYEDKRKAMQRSVEIPQMVREADDIKKLQGKEYKIKIRGMGFDELTAKIAELNRLLNDMDHPLPEALRKDVESLKATYEQWRKEGVMAFDTFRNGWDGMKGMQSGVESLTGALSGNRNAWQMVTGVVDGFLQIYDGIQTVVGIMNMLNTVTQAQAAAKTVEAAATTEAAVAQGAGAVTAEAAAAAQAPVAAANEVTTASYMKLAAAAYYAAHAYIPFAGFGIASGFVTAAAGVVKGIGKVVTATPFANGGVVSGPTVGLIGEYAGASNNPEVVAPLDKLRKLMTPAGAPVIVGGTLRASGRELVCVLANETRIASKSGRKTNIKI